VVLEMSDGDVLRVSDLSLLVGGRAIVDHVTFEARRGEIVAVIGPNGAGKTTLLERLVGLRDGGGRVHVLGGELRTFGDHARAFAFSPDDALPPPEVLVGGLIEHAHRHRPRRADVLRSLLSGLGLESLLDRSAGALSRGERKRLALYVALAADRPVVVLDEPFGAFDPLQLRDVLQTVRLVAEEGAAVVVSIHQLNDAERIADRVLLLSEGRRIAFGTVEEIRAQAGPCESLEGAFVALLSSGRGRHVA
jgi:ABC-2 type transport system ATP-binding protein